MKTLNEIIEEHKKKASEEYGSFRFAREVDQKGHDTLMSFLHQFGLDIAHATAEAVRVEKITRQPLIIYHLKDESEGDFVAKIYNAATQEAENKKREFFE